MLMEIENTPGVSALAKLAALTQQAEAVLKSSILSQELKALAERLNTAKEALVTARAAMETEHPGAEQSLREAVENQEELKRQIKTLAVYRGNLTKRQREKADKLIESATQEIAEKKETAEAKIAALKFNLQEATRVQKETVQEYQHLKKEADRLQLQESIPLAKAAQAVQEILDNSPVEKLYDLQEEVERTLPHFSSLTKVAQIWQFKVWVGVYRLYQSKVLAVSEVDSEDDNYLRRLFWRFKQISTEFHLGHIDVMKKDFVSDWDIYIKEAKAKLIEVTTRSQRY